MKVKSGFVVRQVGDSNFLVATGALAAKFRVMIRLNDTGKLLWDMLIAGRDIDEMVSAMTQKYDVSEEKAKHDAESFISILASKGVFED